MIEFGKLRNGRNSERKVAKRERKKAGKKDKTKKEIKYGGIQ